MLLELHNSAGIAGDVLHLEGAELCFNLADLSSTLAIAPTRHRAPKPGNPPNVHFSEDSLLLVMFLLVSFFVATS